MYSNPFLTSEIQLTSGPTVESKSQSRLRLNMQCRFGYAIWMSAALISLVNGRILPSSSILNICRMLTACHHSFDVAPEHLVAQCHYTGADVWPINDVGDLGSRWYVPTLEFKSNPSIFLAGRFLNSLPCLKLYRLKSRMLGTNVKLRRLAVQTIGRQSLYGKAKKETATFKKRSPLSILNSKTRVY